VSNKLLRVLIISLFLSPLGLTEVVTYRDRPTDADSKKSHILSYRYQRHIWKASDGTLAMIVQQAGAIPPGQSTQIGLSLWTSTDSGYSWNFSTEIEHHSKVICDGVIDNDNDIHLITSCYHPDYLAHSPQYYHLKFTSDTPSTWVVDQNSPETVAPSDPTSISYSMASIALDDNGVLWAACRKYTINGATYQFEIFYYNVNQFVSTGRLYGENNTHFQKNPKLFAWDDGKVGVCYQDANESLRSKRLMYREKNAIPTAPWIQIGSIPMIDSKKHSNGLYTGDQVGTHWCIVDDPDCNLHLVYQDEKEENDTSTRMFYRKISKEGSSFEIGEIVEIADNTQGHYCALSINSTHMYIFLDYSDYSVGNYNRVQYSIMNLSTTNMTPWTDISTDDRIGKLRMSCHEYYEDTGGTIPMVYSYEKTQTPNKIYSIFSCFITD